MEKIIGYKKIRLYGSESMCCCVYIYIYLEPHTTIYKWMFGETTIFYIKICNHPIETTIYKWLFGVPGSRVEILVVIASTLRKDHVSTTRCGAQLVKHSQNLAVCFTCS